MTKTGWVFRIEVVSKSVQDTEEMRLGVLKSIIEDPNVDNAIIDELFEDLKLWRASKVSQPTTDEG